MPRQARKFSKSKIYHIIYKGIDGNDIFYEERDRKYFLRILLENIEEYNYRVFAYCLMSNHIHLVLEIQDEILSRAMKSLSVKYVFYFNKRYGRSGPLFQNRFKSKCVENQKYFLDVCRYVEQNPEKAKICLTQEYIWSSYHEYIGNGKIVDRKVLLHYFDYSLEKYKFFTTKGKSDNITDFIEYEIRGKMSDDELSQLIVNELKLTNINDFSNLSYEDFIKGIEFLKNIQYTNITQISRVIGIKRFKLTEYWK